MCRMLIAVGEFDNAALFDGFLSVARGQNEQHERNSEGVYNHPDGWGIAYVDEGAIKKYKRSVPVWEDEMFGKYHDIRSPVVLLHARKSSSTNRSYENTQPFYRKMSGTEYLFVHNGTIKQELEYDSQFYRLGDVDSEMYFYYMLTSLIHGGENSLIKALSEIEKYTAANMVLMDHETAYAAVHYSEAAAYYTMKLYVDKKCLILSSEALPGFESAQWQKLNNMSLVRINLKNREYEVEEYGSK